MSSSSSGGATNWQGLVFEQRLAVEYCVDMLLGEYAGLPPGHLSSIQLQAPAVIDDLVLKFENGTLWASQAKSGRTLRLRWGKTERFCDALQQLYAGAQQDPITLDPNSQDRVILAVNHRADPHLYDFADWLDKARHAAHWQDLVAVSAAHRPNKTNSEAVWCEKLPALLGAEQNDVFLRFVKKLYVERRWPHHYWWNWLRGRLCSIGVPDEATADTVLAVLMDQVANVAPVQGVLNLEMLQAAGQHLPGFPRPGNAPFCIFRQPHRDEICTALEMPAIKMTPTVTRPEMDLALASDEGWLITGKPGSGKSESLVILVACEPQTPVVVIRRHFNADHWSQLTAAPVSLSYLQATREVIARQLAVGHLGGPIGN
ncbi:MAG: hypothetical protein JXA93_13300, partial [Anaerolineae bacterium]|nr:hypothetical protein [Anaerolineae bacterium]